MAKSHKAIEKAREPEAAAIVLPDYAGKVEGRRSEAAAHNRPRPRIKIVQGASALELKKQYGEGAIVLSPDNALLAEAEQTFVAIPLFLYETYEKHRDIDDKDGGSMVMESTSDPRSPLGRRCVLADPDQRVEKYDGFTAKCYHVLNAVLLIDDGEHKGSVAVASWKIRGGGSRSGRNFAGLIARREDQGVWCYMQRLAFASEPVEANGYSWQTLVARNPEADPFVTEDRIEYLKEQHDVLGRLHAGEGIAVSAEAAEGDEIPV